MEDDLDDLLLLEYAERIENEYRQRQANATSTAMVCHRVDSESGTNLLPKPSIRSKTASKPSTRPIETFFERKSRDTELTLLSEEEEVDESSNPLTDHRMNILILPLQPCVRSYQHDIIMTSILHNTLVNLPTGLGKTLIAAVVLYNFLRWFPHKCVVFMAPTRPLVHQQFEACAGIMGMGEDMTAEITGASSTGNRRAIWQTKRAFFVTPQVLDNDLRRGHCDGDRLVCVVVDEAHRATGNHAYCRVIQELEHRSEGFRVVALSATPGSAMSRVQAVLSNLLISRIEARSEDDPDVRPYVHGRSRRRILVRQDPAIQGACTLLRGLGDKVLQRLVRAKHLFPREASEHTSHGALFLARKRFNTNPPEGLTREESMAALTDFSVAIMLLRATADLEKCGINEPLAALLKFQLTNDSPCSTSAARDISSLRVKMLRDKIRRIWYRVTQQILVQGEVGNSKFGSRGMTAHSPEFLEVLRILQDLKRRGLDHPKISKLEEILLEHFNARLGGGGAEVGSSESAAPVMHGTRVMVFASTRECVAEIEDCLRKHRPMLMATAFIGQATTTGGGKGQSQKQQREVMARFLTGQINTLICTCIGEEGLDVGEVDLIVHYDMVASPIRQVQRSGRTGRQRDGTIVDLLMEGREEAEAAAATTKCLTVANQLRAEFNPSKGKSRLLYYDKEARLLPCAPRPVARHIPRPAANTNVLSRTGAKASSVKIWVEKHGQSTQDRSWMTDQGFAGQDQTAKADDGDEMDQGFSLTRWPEVMGQVAIAACATESDDENSRDPVDEPDSRHAKNGIRGGLREYLLGLAEKATMHAQKALKGDSKTIINDERTTVPSIVRSVTKDLIDSSARGPGNGVDLGQHERARKATSYQAHLNNAEECDTQTVSTERGSKKGSDFLPQHWKKGGEHPIRAAHPQSPSSGSYTGGLELEDLPEPSTEFIVSGECVQNLNHGNVGVQELDHPGGLHDGGYSNGNIPPNQLSSASHWQPMCEIDEQQSELASDRPLKGISLLNSGPQSSPICNARNATLIHAAQNLPTESDRSCNPAEMTLLQSVPIPQCSSDLVTLTQAGCSSTSVTGKITIVHPSPCGIGWDADFLNEVFPLHPEGVCYVPLIPLCHVEEAVSILGSSVSGTETAEAKLAAFSALQGEATGSSTKEVNVLTKDNVSLHVMSSAQASYSPVLTGQASAPRTDMALHVTISSASLKHRQAFREINPNVATSNQPYRLQGASSDERCWNDQIPEKQNIGSATTQLACFRSDADVPAWTGASIAGGRKTVEMAQKKSCNNLNLSLQQLSEDSRIQVGADACSGSVNKQCTASSSSSILFGGVEGHNKSRNAECKPLTITRSSFASARRSCSAALHSFNLCGDSSASDSDMDNLKISKCIGGPVVAENAKLQANADALPTWKTSAPAVIPAPVNPVPNPQVLPGKHMSSVAADRSVAVSAGSQIRGTHALAAAVSIRHPPSSSQISACIRDDLAHFQDPNKAGRAGAVASRSQTIENDGARAHVETSAARESMFFNNMAQKKSAAAVNFALRQSDSTCRNLKENIDPICEFKNAQAQPMSYLCDQKIAPGYGPTHGTQLVGSDDDFQIFQPIVPSKPISHTRAHNTSSPGGNKKESSFQGKRRSRIIQDSNSSGEVCGAARKRTRRCRFVEWEAEESGSGAGETDQEGEDEEDGEEDGGDAMQGFLDDTTSSSGAPTPGAMRAVYAKSLLFSQCEELGFGSPIPAKGRFKMRFGPSGRAGAVQGSAVERMDKWKRTGAGVGAASGCDLYRGFRSCSSSSGSESEYVTDSICAGSCDDDSASSNSEETICDTEDEHSLHRGSTQQRKRSRNRSNSDCSKVRSILDTEGHSSDDFGCGLRPPHRSLEKTVVREKSNPRNTKGDKSSRRKLPPQYSGKKEGVDNQAKSGCGRRRVCRKASSSTEKHHLHKGHQIGGERPKRSWQHKSVRSSQSADESKDETGGSAHQRRRRRRVAAVSETPESCGFTNTGIVDPQSAILRRPTGVGVTKASRRRRRRISSDSGSDNTAPACPAPPDGLAGSDAAARCKSAAKGPQADISISIPAQGRYFKSSCPKMVASLENVEISKPAGIMNLQGHAGSFQEHHAGGRDSGGSACKRSRPSESAGKRAPLASSEAKTGVNVREGCCAAISDLHLERNGNRLANESGQNQFDAPTGRGISGRPGSSNASRLPQRDWDVPTRIRSGLLADVEGVSGRLGPCARANGEARSREWQEADCFVPVPMSLPLSLGTAADCHVEDCDKTAADDAARFPSRAGPSHPEPSCCGPGPDPSPPVILVAGTEASSAVSRELRLLERAGKVRIMEISAAGGACGGGGGGWQYALGQNCVAARRGLREVARLGEGIARLVATLGGGDAGSGSSGSVGGARMALLLVDTAADSAAAPDPLRVDARQCLAALAAVMAACTSSCSELPSSESRSAQARSTGAAVEGGRRRGEGGEGNGDVGVGRRGDGSGGHTPAGTNAARDRGGGGGVRVVPVDGPRCAAALLCRVARAEAAAGRGLESLSDSDVAGHLAGLRPNPALALLSAIPALGIPGAAAVFARVPCLASLPAAAAAAAAAVEADPARNSAPAAARSGMGMSVESRSSLVGGGGGGGGGCGGFKSTGGVRSNESSESSGLAGLPAYMVKALAAALDSEWR